MSRTYDTQAPGMAERIPVGYKGDARYIVGLLQGVLRAVRAGVADEEDYETANGAPSGQDKVRMFVMGPGQLQTLANRIGYETGLVELGSKPCVGLQHEVEDGQLPAWSASGFTCWAEAVQYQWMAVTVMAAIATEPASIRALTESTGDLRAEALEVLMALWALACGMRDRKLA